MTERSVSSLFSIDVDAEIRKLCGRQFASPADRVAELIRTVVAHGASEVRLSIGRRRVELLAPDATLPADLLDTLRAIRDPDVAQDDRHRALVACEERAGLGLLALLAEPRLVLRCGGVELELAPDGVRQRAVTPRPGLRLELRRRVAPAEAAQLARSCRFASLPIQINRRRVSGGLALPEALVALRFDAGECDGVVGLPRDNELCRTAFLRQEIVELETVGVSPRGAAHLAVVRDRHARSSDELDRDRLALAVRAARVELYPELRRRYPELAPRDRLLARNLLFRRCDPSRGAGAHEAALLRGLAIFRRLAGEAVDLAALCDAAQDGVLWAVDAATPGSRPYLVERERIFRLDERERALLADGFGLAFAEPPIRVADRWLSRWWARLRNGLRAVGRGVAAGLDRLRGSRLLDDSELSVAERALVAAVAAELHSGRFLLPGVAAVRSRRVEVAVTARGVLPPRLARSGERRLLCLPRPRLREMSAAHARQPALLYPIMTALFAGFDGFGARKRAVQAELLGLPTG